MGRTSISRIAGTSLAASAIALATLGSSASSSTTTPLPEGCNGDLEGQTLTAFLGERSTLRFEMSNAVPPGHEISSVRFTWGDGTQSAGTARIRSEPIKKGCYVTIFTGRHKYTKIDCRNGVCSKTYRITLRYRDATNHARHTNGRLRAIVLRRPPR